MKRNKKKTNYKDEDKKSAINKKSILWLNKKKKYNSILNDIAKGKSKENQDEGKFRLKMKVEKLRENQVKTQ